jgi:hypothetical protein
MAESVKLVETSASRAPRRQPVQVHPESGTGPAPEIKLGWRMRLGLLQASVNTVAEPQIQAMLPHGV